MKLTLGQAAKAAGISKPSLSAAIKKGRVSAYKNEKGVYEIDPAELFRVYPKNSKSGGEANGKSLPSTNPDKTVDNGGLALLLAEKDKLMAEKDRSIGRLEDEKDQIRKDLEEQREQAKRITLLLEHRTKEPEKDSELKKSLKAMEARLDNQDERVREAEEKAQKRLRQLQTAKRLLDQEKSKGFWQKIFG